MCVSVYMYPFEGVGGGLELDPWRWGYELGAGSQLLSSGNKCF